MLTGRAGLGALLLAASLGAGAMTLRIAHADTPPVPGRWAGRMNREDDPVDGAPWETGNTPTWIYNLSDHPTDVPAFPGAPLGRLRGDAGNDADELDPDGDRQVQKLGTRRTLDPS